MAVKASAQQTILDITDGYSVILTNDSHTFIGDTDSVKGTQSAATQVVVLRGSEQVNATIGNITCPTGVSATSDGKTPSPTITITATEACTVAGVVSIPVVIGEATIIKSFSFAIAYTGATGATGAAGKGIKSTTVTYQAGDSGTTAPTGTWGAAVPTVAEGKYLWSRTVIAYTDNLTSTTYSVAHQGQKGSTGATGSAGKGIKSTKVTYQVGSSGTTAPTGTWSDSVPSASAGQFVWTRTVITYTDDQTSTSYSVGKIGNTGATGAKGEDGEPGADAITVSITSTAGFIFKNTSIATTLQAHVYKAGVELTASQISALGTLKWYKDGSTTPVGTGNTLSISAGDVSSKADYTVKLEG